MRHIVIDSPVWTKEQREEALALVEFIRSHDQAGMLPADLVTACERLRDTLAGMVEQPKQRLRKIGYAWHNPVDGKWAFRNGEQPKDVPGPPPRPSSDVYVLVKTPSAAHEQWRKG